jgi:hypothetical protein
LFLDFAHDGEVHTAAFTVDAPTDTTSPPPSPTAEGDERESH